MSRLSVELKYSNGRTVVSDSYFSAPFKLVSPFYDEDYAKLMIMTASAGIMKGDFYDINIHSLPDTNALITDQSYAKIFNTRDGFAAQRLNIELEENAELIWIPKPVIPFENSSFKADAAISIKENSKLVISEILSCGRIGMGESFKFSFYKSRTAVSIGGKPVFLDNTRLCNGEADFSGIGFFENFTHIGFIYFHGYEKPEIISNKEISAFVTQAKCGYVVRLMGNSADKLYKYAVDLVLRTRQKGN